VLGHADGICHLFIDIEANLDMALSVALDSKIQYPAACNAIETLLVHKDIAPAFLEKAIPLFNSNDVKLIGDKRSVELGLIYEASLEDWKTEYLDLILSIIKKNKESTKSRHLVNCHESCYLLLSHLP